MTPPKAPPKRPPLERSTSRSSQYAHVRPKVQTRLPPEYLPGESQFRRPRHKRSDLHISSGEQLREEDEDTPHSEYDNEEPRAESSSSPTHNSIENNDTVSVYPSPTPSNYSADILTQFGPQPGDALPPTTPSPAYHSDGEPKSKSRTPSRRHSLIHPTSNPAAYAKNTDSYQKKMNEKVEWNTSAPSTPPIATLEWERRIRFEEPAKPSARPRGGLGHDRMRAQSLFTGMTAEKVVIKQWQAALGRTGRDLLLLRENLFGEQRKVEVGVVLGEREEMPPDVNGVRHLMGEVVRCWEWREAEMVARVAEDIGKLQSKGEEDERRIKGQERVIVEFEERLKMRDEELVVKERENTIREGKQGERIRELEDALQQSGEELQRERERTSDSDAQEAQKQLQALSSHTDTLQTSLVQKTKELASTSSQISQLQKALQSRPAHAVSEAQLKEAFRLHEHQAQKIAQLEGALQAKTVNDALATGTDTPEWHALFTRERKVKAAQDRQIAHLTASITKLNAYHVDLERESAALKDHAALHRDTVRVLRDQLAASARAAEGWREEFAQQKAMLDGRAVAEETALTALRDEMQRAIVAYQALMPTPGHPDALEITGLARKLSALETILHETTARVDVLKGEKLALEKAMEKVMDERQELREEIERLKSGPPPPSRVFYDEETGEEVPIPSWDTSERLLQRGIAVADFRAKREDARRKAEAEERFAEKARAWKMDKWYPPSRRDFTASPKTSAWERWDVKRWVEEKASDAEYDEASRLGLLKERERRWRRTNEWKGRRLGSMGLRSWDVEELGC